MILVVLLLGVIGDATYAGIWAARDLRDARDELDEAKEAFESGDLTTSRNGFGSAADHAADASTRLERPGVRVVAGLPYLGSDIDVVQALAQAADKSAQAGDAAVEVGSFLGVTSEGVADKIYSDGAIHFDALSRAQPIVDEVSALLAAAKTILSGAPEARVGFIQDALVEARSQMAEAVTSATKAHSFLNVLPALLAEDSSRRYLLAFQALGEARATGGLVGLFGVLLVEDGNLRLGHIGPIKEISSRLMNAVRGPKWFERAYGPQLALEQVQQANVSPNFPVVSKVLLRMYDSAIGGRLSGVIAMDPVALQELLTATGPLKSPLGPTVDSTNAAEVLMKDSYEIFPDRKSQDEYLAGLIDAFWTKIKRGDVSAPKLATALNDAVQSQHFKIYSIEPEEQAAIEELDASGSYTSAGDDVQLVFGNNYGLNKIDYFLRRSIETRVELFQRDAQVTTTVTLENRAPSGPPSVLIGEEGNRVPPGVNKMLLSFLLPPGATAGPIWVDGNKKRPSLYRDDGHLVPWYVLGIGPGETRTVKLIYLMPRTSIESPFELTLFPQATPFPDTYSIEVFPPTGYEIAPAEPVGSSYAESFSSSGDLDRPRSFTLRVSSN